MWLQCDHMKISGNPPCASAFAAAFTPVLDEASVTSAANVRLQARNVRDGAHRPAAA